MSVPDPDRSRPKMLAESPQIRNTSCPIRGANQSMPETEPTDETPMIEVRGLTKRFKRRTAVEDLSFTVGRGQVVGFLGPNGAGKTTTMRMLSCYMPATSGTARIGGYNVYTNPDEVRRMIGYMPESNPLYTDMRVREYLKCARAFEGTRRPIQPRPGGSRNRGVRIDRRFIEADRPSLQGIPTTGGTGGCAGSRSRSADS